ncbi:MAG: hypothetical protein H5T69_05050, partial [Chloroflexi bacterium]|nr:hypothetical protein [Chloroflexota bacterium]
TRYEVATGSIPEVFIGEDVLIGGDEIRARLRERIAHYAAQGGVALPSLEALAGPTPAPSAYANCDTCDDKHSQPSSVSSAEGVARAVLFWSDTCPACHMAREQVLPPIVARYGPRLELRAVEITAHKNEDVWDATMAALQIPRERRYIPMLLIGEWVLVGGQQIAENLPLLVDQYLAAGGVDFPPVPGVSFETYPLFEASTSAPASSKTVVPTLGAAPKVYIAYFYQPGCNVCERAEHDLRYIQEKYPQVEIRRFDVKEEAAFNQYLCDQAGVPENKHLTAPALFTGNGYLLGDEIRVRAIEELIAPYLATGTRAPWADWENKRELAQSSIIERFKSLSLLTVVGAGLLDGVNPCAFATMIFLISYLTMRKRQGAELLATGGAFAFGVFVTYLGIGFGFLKFLSSLPFLNVIGKWVYGVTAILCLGLAWGSIVDYRRAREGRLEDMSLKLPERLRELSKRLIREGTGSRRFVLSSFALGFGVSVVELACTGQVYLPTIIFVLGIPEWRTQASLALLLYNAMFILPLIGVFLLVYYGTTSEQLIGWMQKHAATVKLGMATLFVLLAGWLIYSIIATL